MSDTRVAVLTPAGTGAIATVAVVGPRAWDVVRGRFRPAGGKPSPPSPAPHRFWFGTLGEGAGDEVVVAVTRVAPAPWVEVHCHGGRRVVRWLVDQFRADGCIEVGWQSLTKTTRDNGWAGDDRALEPLTKAPTLRTASILLDQYHGAFTREVSAILALLDAGDGVTAGPRLAGLAGFAPVGRHLVSPWAVAVAGPPNVGKSSLINALAGYQRSVVAPVAGTTRDVVTVAVALDGWPVELADTAGLRDASDELEAAGVDRARRLLARAAVVVWVFDATDPDPVYPEGGDGSILPVVNKTDLTAAWDVAMTPAAAPVSAATGAGVPELAAAIAARLAPAAPPAGAAVPFTGALADRVEQALRHVQSGELAAAREALTACLPGPAAP